MSLAGKSLTQSSHDRIQLYKPIIRFLHEIDTFHTRAVEDTRETVNKLEEARAKYRASLLWMRDISQKLNPDVYKQLERFRRVQAQVRSDKQTFDQMKLDVFQKIDLLMGSRCNLLNQALGPYQEILLNSHNRNLTSFRDAHESMSELDIYEYEFESLKQLNPLVLRESPPMEDPVEDPLELDNDDENQRPTREPIQEDLLLDLLGSGDESS